MNGPSFLIKICGITNEEDARTAVEAGANALGFNFYPKSPRYISPDQARKIAAAVPGDYLRVGVFVNPPAEQLLSTSELVPLDVVQLHGDDCPPILSRPLRIWRAIAPSASTDDGSVEAWLLDKPSPEFGGSGLTFDWKLAQTHRGRIVLAGGLSALNVAEAIRIADPWGVDACSRLESTPGKKNPKAVQHFVQTAIRAANLNSIRPVAAVHAPPTHPTKASI